MIYESTTEIYRPEYSDREIKAMEVEKERLALAKANERPIVQAFVRGLPLDIQAIDTKLSSDLDTLAGAMKKYATSTLVADLDYGLTGKGADAAKDYLTEIKKPDLKSPIKGVSSNG